jgi:DNA repair photolyase
MLKAFRKTNASIGLHMMPIIPFLTDTYENLNSICEKASEIDVHYLLPGTLYLKGKTRPYFLNFIKEHFPELYSKFNELYKTGGSSKIYKDKLYAELNSLRTKYKISSSYSKPMKEKMHKDLKPVQTRLF